MSESWQQILSYVDAHLHLADPEYADKIESTIENAAQNKVAHLLSNAVDYETSLRTISLAKNHKPMVVAAVGLHPWTVVNNPASNLADFERLIDENREHVAAIGEIGLDGKYIQDEEKKSHQRDVFRFFLDLAERKRLPVMVHSRLAVEEVLDELSRFNPPGVLLHWYDGPIEKLELIKNRGYLISIGPSLFYSKRVAEIARKADLNTILSETDGPVKHHGPFEGKVTQPSFVLDVTRKLAEIRSDKMETVRNATWQSFHTLLQDKLKD
jgi:TatD DNase family protein